MNPTTILALSLFAAEAICQQQTVVPNLYATSDANSHLRVAGVFRPLRQQTIVGANHLQSLVGHQLTGLSFRRTAATEAYAGGSSNWTVSLSTAARPPLGVSAAYAENVGANAVTCFTGMATLPASPPTTGPTIDWAPDKTVQITFQQPFLYQGGPLCIDITGAPIASQSTWWMADCVFDDVSGSMIRLGVGCGTYGTTWSDADVRALIAGGTASFSAQGAPGGLAIMALGTQALLPGVPLTALGLPSPPACQAYLLPATVLGSIITVFEPRTQPNTEAQGGGARVSLALPNQTWLLGQTFVSQWLDLTQFASSDALQWTIASNQPTLGMASVEGDPTEALGNVAVHMAHVLRIDHYQP